MNGIIVTVGSVTYAIKLRRLLSRSGIRSKLVKVDNKAELGCTHGIEINGYDFYAVVEILKNNGFDYRIYNK